ncbi:MAG: thiamine transport system substrate-binding protein [bacterium]|jgi:thiamine transport system substrate-binding protein
MSKKQLILFFITFSVLVYAVFKLYNEQPQEKTEIKQKTIVQKPTTPTLTIYTYDSFNSKWGPGPIVFNKFRKECNCKLKIVAPGDEVAALNRVILEKNRPKADILLGFNNSRLGKVFEHNILIPYNPPLLKKVASHLKLDPQNRAIPFDYGHMAFIYDTKKIKVPPTSLDDLLSSRFHKKIVIQSPKTSSPGISFLHWTIAKYGEDHYLEYWKKLQKNLLTVTAGWSSAYGMFTKGEVPIVLSYVTSPAYHLHNEKTERYQAAIFKDGHYQQIEMAGIVKGTKNLKLAQKFIDFMLSEKFQNEIPLKNWMFPVIEYKPLPASFKIALKPKQIQSLDPSKISKNNSKWLAQWTRAVGR